MSCRASCLWAACLADRASHLWAACLAGRAGHVWAARLVDRAGLLTFEWRRSWPTMLSQDRAIRRLDLEGLVHPPARRVRAACRALWHRHGHASVPSADMGYALDVVYHRRSVRVRNHQCEFCVASRDAGLCMRVHGVCGRRRRVCT
eukprot:366242-Chlamydomonas_euryale.AAC.3